MTASNLPSCHHPATTQAEPPPPPPPPHSELGNQPIWVRRALCLELVPTAKRLRGEEAVNAQIKGQSVPFWAK